MALAFGTGPFSKRPAGRFSVAAPPAPLAFWEPFLKRLRVVVKRNSAVDTRNAVALHKTGSLMSICVPRSDMNAELMPEGSFERTSDDLVGLDDYVSLDFGKLDRWYLEDDLGYAHPRDPYHRCDVHRTSRHVRVSRAGVTIAESSAVAVLFETSIAPRYYFAPDAVDVDLLERSKTVSQCPYKGDGQHWHVVVDGSRVEDAGWNLTTPLGDALTIPRWFSFYAEKLDIELDGRRLEE